MKTMKKIKILMAGICALSIIAACDYENVNTNPYEMTDEMGLRDGISLGGYITLMERWVIPVGTQADGTKVINAYQTAYMLSSDGWSGYFGQDNNWSSGQNNLTYYLVNAWVTSTYNCSYTNLLPSWKKLKSRSEELNAPEVFALAQILKVSAWHKTLETFGPIPYKEAGAGLLVVPFDSEKDVYDSMFADLKAAIDVLTPFAGNNIVSEYDAVYGGDVTKWIKYANSLMLRLAMRIRYVDQDTAKKWVSTALSNSFGVMTAKEDEAQMSSGAGYQFVNNINYMAAQYSECRMGTSLFAYLNGYKDPRLAAYFKESESEEALTGYDGKKYAPVPPGTNTAKGTYELYSLPNMTSTTPSYWMRASEVYFLRAEAALVWPEFGSAEDLYKEGIAMSFKENGISSSVDSYLSDTGVPQAISIHGYSAPAPTSATKDFSGNEELQLEKIMIQKWLAMYPNGHEAWTEWRRTGYPVLNQVMVNAGSGQGITKSEGIRRMIYPTSFYQSEQDMANYQEALQKLGGEDRPTTRLWWDVR